MLSVICALSFAYSQGSNAILGDLHLQKVTTLIRHEISVEDLLSILSKGTDVKLESDRNIRDRKVSIAYEDQKTAGALAAVADVLLARWDKTTTGWRIVLPDTVVKEEREQRRLESEGALVDIGSFVKHMESYKGLSYDEMMSEAAALREKLDPHAEGGPASAAERLALRERLKDLSELNWIALGVALAGDKSLLNQLLTQGNCLIYNDGSPGLHSLDLAQCSPHFVNGKRYPTTSLYAVVTWNSKGSSLDAKFVAGGSPFGDAMLTISAPIAVKTSRKGPLEARMESWAKPLDASVLSHEISPTDFPDDRYGANAATLGDHVEYLERSTHVPVIADAFRLAVSTRKPIGAPTVAAYLEGLAAPDLLGLPRNLFGQRGPVRSDGGWLMIRHQRSWSLIEGEIPEPHWMPLRI
jgi:hypothetical protein